MVLVQNCGSSLHRIYSVYYGVCTFFLLYFFSAETIFIEWEMFSFSVFMMIRILRLTDLDIATVMWYGEDAAVSALFIYGSVQKLIYSCLI